MKAEVINPFLSATTLVFEQILGEKMMRGKTILRSTPLPNHEVAIFITLKGKYIGNVIYSMNMESVIKIAHKLSPGMNNAQILKEYRDIMGELANMITGNAIQAFVNSNADLDLSVPFVADVRAKKPRIKDQPTLSLNLYTRFGLLEINIALQ